MTDISHRVKFYFEKSDQLQDGGDVVALSKTLQRTLSEGCEQYGMAGFGPLRHDLRRDISEKVFVCLVASFDFTLDAAKLPKSFETDDLFWTDSNYWNGFKCNKVEVLAPINVIWTYNYRMDDPAFKAAFDKFGRCTAAKTPKGSVLVTYDNIEDAKRAVEDLQGKCINDDPNKKLSVDYAARHLRSVTGKDQLLETDERQHSPADNRQTFRVVADNGNRRIVPQQKQQQQQQPTYYDQSRSFDGSNRDDFRNNSNRDDRNNNLSSNRDDGRINSAVNNRDDARNSSGGSADRSNSGDNFRRDFRGSSDSLPPRRDFRDSARDSGAYRDMRVSPRTSSASRPSRDDRPQDNRRRLSRSPISRSPTIFQSSNNAIMPTLDRNSTIMQVANWFECIDIDTAIKAAVIDLIQSEKVDGSTFCSFDSIEVVERQFGVKFLLCDRNTVRKALLNFRII